MAGDRVVDPEGDAPVPDVDIIAVTSAVTGTNVAIEVELAGDWLARGGISLFLATGTRGAGACWGFDADYAIQLTESTAEMTSDADGWNPGLAEPVTSLVDGPRVTFELPLAHLGNPQVLYVAAYTSYHEPYSDLLPDTPGFPDDVPRTCPEMTVLPDTAMTPSSDVGNVVMLVGVITLLLGVGAAIRRPVRQARAKQ